MVCFQHVTRHAWTYAGALIVIAAALYTVHRERQKAQALVRSPDGRGYSNT